jgi:ferredoxin
MQGGKGMAFKITEDCIACAACESECPNEAISEGDEYFVIDPANCTECVGFYSTQQCADVCPVEACVPDPDHKEGKEELLAKFKKLHPDKEPKL